MSGKNVLLHACCAPCFGYVNTLLSLEYDVTVLFYNPNIAPHEEYLKRLHELETFCRDKNIPLIIGEYRIGEWTGRVEQYKSLGERSQRCRVCFSVRLEEACLKAREMGIGAVATTLTVSPHKDSAMVNSVGRELTGSYGMEFIEADFKKNDGYRKSVEISRRYGFYRQDYCGCIYSKMEREESRERKKTGDYVLILTVPPFLLFLPIFFP